MSTDGRWLLSGAPNMKRQLFAEMIQTAQFVQGCNGNRLLQRCSVRSGDGISVPGAAWRNALADLGMCTCRGLFREK